MGVMFDSRASATGVGVVLRDVFEGGPAADAGLVPGDVLVGLGDERLVGAGHLVARIEQLAVGDIVQVIVASGQALREVSIELAPRESEDAVTTRRLRGRAWPLGDAFDQAGRVRPVLAGAATIVMWHDDTCGGCADAVERVGRAARSASSPLRPVLLVPADAEAFVAWRRAEAQSVPVLRVDDPDDALADTVSIDGGRRGVTVAVLDVRGDVRAAAYLGRDLEPAALDARIDELLLEYARSAGP
jgi:hypothetical protein